MRKSRLSRTKQNKLVEHFVAGTSARFASGLLCVNRNTTSYYYHRLREIIAVKITVGDPDISIDGIEAYESYFGCLRMGKRARGAASMVPVFRILYRDGKVYTKILSDDSEARTLVPTIQEKVIPEGFVLSDRLRGYNLLNASEMGRRYNNHEKFLTDKPNNINGVGKFWNYAKQHMQKFNGVPNGHFPLFLKECEWRFNNPKPQTQLSQLKQWAKKEMG